MKDFPRRNSIYLRTPAEKAIADALEMVERSGCDPLLTEAVVLLDQAREKVADFVDREIQLASMKKFSSDNQKVP